MAVVQHLLVGGLSIVWYMLSRAVGFAAVAGLITAVFWLCRPAEASPWLWLVWLSLPLYALAGLAWGLWLGLGRLWEPLRPPLAERLGQLLARQEARVEQLAGAFADQSWVVRMLIVWILALPDVSERLVEVTAAYRACPEKNGPLSHKVSEVLLEAVPLGPPERYWLLLVFAPQLGVLAYLWWG